MRFGTIADALGRDGRREIERGGIIVRVITIMDDVYSDLYKLKKSKDMSFSELFRFMLKERREGTGSIISLSGSIGDDDINRRALYRRDIVWSR